MQEEQEKFWSGAFGKEWIDRNVQVLNEAFHQRYVAMYGKSRIQLNTEFLEGLPKDAKILEIGCGNGIQLNCLQSMGFTELYGIELQPYAVEKAKLNTNNITIVQGSAFDIPFEDGFFDLIFTNGLLVIIHPPDLPTVFAEMHRCTSKYIWGLEFFEEGIKEINYRSNTGVLWKADYAKMMNEQFPDLEIVKKELLPYLIEAEKGNTDCMYLLKRRNS